MDEQTPVPTVNISREVLTAAIDIIGVKELTRNTSIEADLLAQS